MPEYRRKLIEVAFPLEAVNRGAAQEKNPFLKGHPRNIHLWWSRKPLSICRAVLFASLVDDPSSSPEHYPTIELQDMERRRLFGIMEEMVDWANVNNETVMNRARREIERATGGSPPIVLDPFSGGGSIPLEAQRLGLQAIASDLNPVATLIGKALIEIPPIFADLPPVGPQPTRHLFNEVPRHGAAGLADDVEHYGKMMLDQVTDRIGDLYPRVPPAGNDSGASLPVTAWLWTRTVKCPNPACGIEMPLSSKWWLSKKKGKNAWLVPRVDAGNTVRYEIHKGDGAPPTAPKVGRGATFKCVACGALANEDYVKVEARASRMSVQLMAVAAEGDRQRVFLPPSPESLSGADVSRPDAVPSGELAHDPRSIWCISYGMTTVADLFTNRQLHALVAFTDAIAVIREAVVRDAVSAGLEEDGVRLADGGTGAVAYADAVAVYLACAVDHLARYSTALATWNIQNENVAQAFGRQTLGVAWDFAECNVLEGPLSFMTEVGWVAEALRRLPATVPGESVQMDAAHGLPDGERFLISTDPPYYDNIGYSDLSDFFYVWMRRALGSVDPTLFATMLTPKEAEIVLTPYRFSGHVDAAKQHFQEGLLAAFQNMKAKQSDSFPLTIYYAYKQSESDESDVRAGARASSGWELMLTGLIDAGFTIVGTWPVGSERTRGLKSEENALGSSIVLVCRPRSAAARMATRREFIATLRERLPDALRTLQHGSIAPVDLAQAAVGPGMAVFSACTRVVETDGSSMGVRTALGIINQILDEVLAAQEGEYDPSTRWALAWFEQFGHDPGPFGQAEVLSKAKAVSVQALASDGLVESRTGSVRLRRREELAADWDPTTDSRLTVWEITQHLTRALDQSGEAAAARLLHAVGPALGDIARDLAYRLYALCERKGWPTDAAPYNALAVAFPALVQLAGASGSAGQTEMEL